MNKLRKQSSTTYPLFFFMVDSSDHITGKTGLSPTVTISKNGGSYASPSGAVSEVGNGLYKIAGNATDSNTLGELWIHATGTGADPTDVSYSVVPFNPFATAIDTNLIQIDGSATNGNNATLKLKSLDLRSNDTAVASLEIRGATGGPGLSGGKAFNIIGGAAGTGGAAGGDAIYAIGGGGTSTRGFGLYLDAAVAGSGLKVIGNMSSAAVFSGYNGNDIVANIVGNLSGSVGSISSVRPKKNTGLDNFMYPMFDSTTKNPKTGLTVTAERAIDGNPFAPCSNSAAELSNGVYRVSLSADDLNGDKIMLRFSAPGADDQLVEIITQD